jgi:hypothetical protein
VNKIVFSLLAVILALLFFSSCSKDIIQNQKPSDPRDSLVGDYNFEILNHYLEFEVDTIRTNQPPGFVCKYRYKDIFKNYTSRGSVVKSDSAHQLMVYWGHDTIPLSRSFSPTIITKMEWSYHVPNKLSFYEPYINNDSLGFGITPMGGYSWIVEGKKIK